MAALQSATFSARLATASSRSQKLLFSRYAVARPLPRITVPSAHFHLSSRLLFQFQNAQRHFSSSSSAKVDSRPVGSEPSASPDSPSPASGREFDDMIETAQKGNQTRTPWHREGSNLPPVRQRQRSAGAMTKGKLLTTPSRLLKLIIPLTTDDRNSDRKDMQPLALLVHPQQPLSYLERLIQAELPTITDKDGRQKIPAVHFKAEDLGDDEIRPQKVREKEGEEAEGDSSVNAEKGAEEVKMDGKTIHTGKISSDAGKETGSKDYGIRGGPGEGGVESYSGAGRSAADKTEGEQGLHKLVRWSTSTEIGDFIRDAARGKEFAVEIEGPAGAEEAAREIRVGVPSFNDRTYYLRTRLRKLSARISSMADVKEECDNLARRSAKHVAMGGFGGLLSWWVGVWYLTFQTSLGWDVMEPVTYLVGLSTLMGGYLWFLYHNREVSYRSALNLTVSRRQTTLYHAKGFDLNRWESLVQDANALRYEIRKVADEYDVEWDETKDEHDEKVTRALRRERETSRKRDKEAEEDEEKEPEPEPEPKESKGDGEGKEAGKP